MKEKHRMTFNKLIDHKSRKGAKTQLKYCCKA
jgi:hypothetical protein